MIANMASSSQQMAGVTTVCVECEGRRFQAAVLDYRLGGLNIAEVLDLSVEDGGRIVFEGTPADLVAARPTLTGEHLAAFVGSTPRRARA